MSFFILKEILNFVNRKIPIIILTAAIILTTVIIIGSYSFSVEPEKMSYSVNATIERAQSGDGLTSMSCERSYPDLCIPKDVIELSCDNIIDKNFTVKYDDPNNLDPDGNGIGCE
jgi:hypothetical protein